ncbi:hypothetical protein ACTFIR_007862 [Dictyostelium discoideum]
MDPPKLTFISKRDTKKKDEVNKEQQPTKNLKILDLFSNDEEFSNPTRQEEPINTLQEKLMNVDPLEFFSKGGLKEEQKKERDGHRDDYRDSRDRDRDRDRDYRDNGGRDRDRDFRDGGGRDRDRNRDRDRDRDRDYRDGGGGRDRYRDNDRYRDTDRYRDNDRRDGGSGSSSGSIRRRDERRDNSGRRDYRDNDRRDDRRDNGRYGRDNDNGGSGGGGGSGKNSSDKKEEINPVSNNNDIHKDRIKRDTTQFSNKVFEQINNKRDREDPELRDIKVDYMGIKRDENRKKIKGEKGKFVFEWDSSEDTSSDYNTLYTKKLEIQPQFGHGNFGGYEKNNNNNNNGNHHNGNIYNNNNNNNNNINNNNNNNGSIIGGKQISELPDTHWSKKPLKSMTKRDWHIFKEDFNISTKGGIAPNPIRTWQESNLPREILEAIRQLGYEKPSPIQMQSIPISLTGRDILGIAETGSGKTCAFVIPMLIYISKQPRLNKDTEADGPYALVMAPTRELVQQIEKETRNFAQHFGFRVVSLVGGQSIEDQAYQVSKGCEIIIATPGRLNDCLEKRYLVLNQCNYIVLDEADMMIDLGFEPQVTSVLDAMPSSFLKSEDDEMAEKQESDRSHIYRTTILFSATMPPLVEKLSKKYLRRPCTITIGEAGKVVDRIRQTVIFVKSENDKKEHLTQLIKDGPPPPIIIFVNKKKHCDIIAPVLEECRVSYTILHSGRSQEQREAALEGFKKRKYEVLIATGVASRGIHVDGVTHVINFDIPKNIEDYTHRIGRTGRAGSAGLASSFITDKDVEIMYDLKQILTSTNNIVPIELLKHPSSQQKHGSSKDHNKSVIFK